MILLVEDEAAVREPLREYLAREGFEVRAAATAADADRELAARPALVILDWMIGRDSGLDLLRRWRASGWRAPCLLLTARTELADKVLALELGANDYVTKPFEPRELVARVRAHLRVAGGGETDEICAAGVALDARSREVRFGGRPVALTKTEFDLLRLLLENPNQVFSRGELLNRVWGYQNYPTTRTVDTHVLQLRTKLAPELIETVHRIGYRLRAARRNDEEFASP